MLTRIFSVNHQEEQWHNAPLVHCPQCGAIGQFIWMIESCPEVPEETYVCLACDHGWLWTEYDSEWIKARTLRLRAIIRDRGIAVAAKETA